MFLIIRHEARLLWRGRTFVTCVLLLGVVIAFGAANGAAWARHQQSTIETIERKDAERYAEVKAELADLARRGDPRPRLDLAGMAWYLLQPGAVDAPAPAPHIDPRRAEAAGSEWVGARHAVLPPAPLAALAIGQSDLHPYYSRVTIRTQPTLVNSDEIENPANLVNGRFDLAFALTFCWPLLVLPLAYNLLSEERERGTLALVLSQPVSLRTVLLAKVIARAGLLVAATMVISLAALVWMADVALDQRTGIDIAMWMALILVNGLLWFGVAAWINSAGRGSALNAMVIAAAWLAWVVVVPSLVGLVASLTAPVPSRVQLINEVRAAGNLASPALAQLMTAYQEEHPDVAPAVTSADTVAMRGLALQDETDRRVAPVLDAYRAARARQQTLVTRLSFLSPAILSYEAAGELAGTSTARYRRFSSQVDEFHREWRAYFYPFAHRQVAVTAEDYDRAPRFAFKEEPASDVRARVMIAILVIGALGIIMLALGIRSLTSPSAL